MPKKTTETNVSPDDIANCFAELESFQIDAARLGQRKAAMLGRYEALGVDVKTVKLALAAAKKDPREAAAEHARLTEYKRICGVLIVEEDGQIAMSEELMPHYAVVVSEETASRLAVVRAHSDGYNSGLAGGPIEGSTRYKTGSEEFVSWRDGWTDGAADREMRKPKLIGVTSPEPRSNGEATNIGS